MSNYPTYPTQPFTGNLIGLVSAGPPDLRASSSTAPYYQGRIDRMYGRHLAGFGEVQDEAAEPDYTLNELRIMAEMDDVNGNGVFDQPGTRPNLYRDAGIFAGRYSIPGYIDREVTYRESEIIDATTGRPVVYVPSGAVAIDSAAQVAHIEGGRYNAPAPPFRHSGGRLLPQQSTVNVMQSPVPVTKQAPPAVAGLPFGMSHTAAAVLLGALGLAGTVAYFTMRKKG
jgi:hypothetical protein